MLNDHQLKQLCDELALSEPARAIINTIRSSPPVRRVRSSTKSVSARYPSRKMGVTIQAESHRNELAFIYELEHDDQVLAYYDQPSQIKLQYRAASGKNVGVLHTPDFFVLRADRVGWVECKTEEELKKLTKKMPARYVQDETGCWRCPPGERYAQQFGFYYHVRSSAEIDWTFQRNMIFLQDYLRADCLPVDVGAAQEICQLITAEPGIRLAQLLNRIERATSDDVYLLMASGQVYVDPYQAPLAEPERVRLFRDQWTARAFVIIPDTLTEIDHGGYDGVNFEVNALVHWDGQPWTIINIGQTEIWLRSTNQKMIKLSPPEFRMLVEKGAIVGSKTEDRAGLSTQARELLAKASPEDLKTANDRYQIIRPVLEGQRPADTGTSPRTIRDWVAKYRQAQQVYRWGYLGLLPRLHQSGNRTQKLPTETWNLINQFIEDNYESFKQKRMFEVYGELMLACDQQGVQTPSYKTFARAVRRRSRYRQTKKREGNRRAYVHEPFYWELQLTTPRHGDRPFEIGHLDHTQLDIELVHSVTGRNLGRPWATFLTDAFSRRLLAVYLSFESPSYRSCMMVLREGVRLHQRLPQILVVDGGPEFGSVYFETLLAYYECTKKTRPAGKGRFGSVCERLFGTTNTRFVYNLAGNTQITRHVRQMTKAVNPKKHAQWTLPRLYLRLRQWAYEVYDTIEHPALGQTPREAFGTALIQSGQRAHRFIPYDEEFYLHTLPTTRKGTAKVDANRGVKVNYIYYWTNDFRHPEVADIQVPVRYDPFDAGMAYAFVQGRWVRCVSEYYARLQGRSEVEIRLATAELRARNQRHTRQLPLTARHIADFIDALQQEESAQEKLMCAGESKQVVTLINAGQFDDNVNHPLDPEQPDVATGYPLKTSPSAQTEMMGDNAPLKTLEDYLI